MKKYHPEQIASNALVVRHVLDRLSELEPAACRNDVLAGMSLVERWIAGGPVRVEELSQLAKAIHSSGGSFVAHEPPHRAWSWAGTAVGNLCWMASKERGWTDGNRTVMDGAVSALTSLLPSGGDAEQRKQRSAEGLALRERLEAMRTTALADLVEKKAGQGKPPRRRAQVPRLGRPEGLARLGPVVAKWLARCSARIDPRATRDEPTLRELASKKGHAVSDALCVFEKRYGGLVVAESPARDDRDWLFGAWVCLERGLGDEFRELGFVPVAASANDLFYYLDARGAAWAFDAIEDPEPVPYAPDGDRMLGRIALYNLNFHRRNRDQSLLVEGRHGQRIAEELGVPLIEEASDDGWRAWGDARRLVIEHVGEGGVATLVSGPGAKRFARGGFRPVE